MIPVFPVIFHSSVASPSVNPATLFTMLCSDIGIHLDSTAFSEILNRHEVRTFYPILLLLLGQSACLCSGRDNQRVAQSELAYGAPASNLPLFK